MLSPRDGTRRRRRAGAALSIMVVAAGGIGLVATTASYSESESTPATTFTAGTLDLSATSGPTSSAVDLGNLAPGDVVSTDLTLVNSGTLDLCYTASALIIAAGPSSDGSSEALLPLRIEVFDASGAVVGVIADTAAAGPGAIALVGARDLSAPEESGDPDQGAARAEALLVRATLDAAAPNSVQDTSATVTLVFEAAQTGGCARV